jgi:hypothetical protein
MRLTSQNCSLCWPIVHSRVIVMWTMVWWCLLGLTPNLSTSAIWQQPLGLLSGGPVNRDISGASRRMGERNENLVSPSPWDFKRSLTCRNMSRRGTLGFGSHPKEDVLRIFVALTNPSPWPCSNPRTMRPVAITPTTTPPRWLSNGMFWLSYCTPLKVTVVPLLSELATTDTNRSVKKQVGKQKYLVTRSSVFLARGSVYLFMWDVYVRSVTKWNTWQWHSSQGANTTAGEL